MGSTEIAKQVIYIFVVSFCFYILYFKILSSVFVLGIKSHKLLPTLFLEGCSDSDGNGLEIARGVGRVVSNAGRWTTWISRWSLGKVTTPKSGSVQSALGAHTHPSPPVPWCQHGLSASASSRAAAGGETNVDLSPHPQVSKETVFVASLNCLCKVVPLVPSSISKSWTQIIFSRCDHAA